MTRTQFDREDCELDYAYSYRSLPTPNSCRQRTGTEQRNLAARYGSRPNRKSSATQGTHRRGKRGLTA